MRDEQRRRTSQYDRGTSLAEREEFYHNSALMYPYGCKLNHQCATPDANDEADYS